VSIVFRQVATARLIDAWDAGLAQHPVDRVLTIAGCYTDRDRRALAALSIGERDALLLRIHRLIVGDRLSGVCACSSCAERNEFDLDASALPDPSPPHDGVVTVTVGERSLRARLPNSFDLAAVVDAPDEDAATRIIVRRCLLDETLLDDDVVGAVDRAMEQVEGVAALDIAFACSACGAENRAPLDIAGFLWLELSERVQGVIADVELLASAYGWSEADILAMSDRRRALYAERMRR
jgi:hypothetical protein